MSDKTGKRITQVWDKSGFVVHLTSYEDCLLVDAKITITNRTRVNNQNKSKIKVMNINNAAFISYHKGHIKKQNTALDYFYRYSALLETV